MLHAAYRSIVRRLPVSLKAPMKQAAFSILGRPTNVSTLSPRTPVVEGSGRQPDGSDLMDFVRPETMTEILSHLQNPNVITQMQFARMVIARDRAAALLKRRVEKVSTPTPTVIHSALDYNFEAAHTSPMEDRPMNCTHVVSSIGRVAKYRDKMHVLSIGPRV